ncbi:beta-lactamase family protein [Xylogone sp. PMI_703]|nr:beta-lactamase family protein [Xylogone sp. PMI_703]
MSRFSAQTASAIRKLADDAVINPELGLPGVTVVVIDKDGKELLTHATGTKGYGSKEPITLDTVYWMASCTKMITGIAVMQLVEQGKLRLDDVEQVEQLAPELKTVKVLQEDGSLVDKKRGITLRMLLTHTAGFSYPFFSENLRDFNIRNELVDNGFQDGLFKLPLVNQPGEKFAYGFSMDWAGVLLERITGLSLNDYMDKHIFQPLGLKSTSFIPSKEMKERLVNISHRRPDGTLAALDHVWHWPLNASTEEEIAAVFHSGGGGCFTTISEYCQILSILLNDGVSPTTGARILQKSTIDQMFTNQLPHIPNVGREPLPTAIPILSNDITDFYPFASDLKQPLGWGLTFMLTPEGGGITGRKAGTAFWVGLPNMWWWCDRESGVAGMVATQVLPFGDKQLWELWNQVETVVYDGLKEGRH